MIAYTRVPVAPQRLGAVSEAEHVVIAALNLGDPFQQASISSLREEPRMIKSDSRAHEFLRGACLTATGDTLIELSALVTAIADHDAVLIGGHE